MACLVRPSAALQRPSTPDAALQARAAHRWGSSGGAATRRAAPLGGSATSWLAGSPRPSSRLRLRPCAQTSVPPTGPASSSGSGGSGSSDGSTAEARYRGGSKPSPVPDVDAGQLLRSLGLDGAADPAALLKRLRKLPGVRQQGVLDHAAAVTAHLLSPAVGLTAQQVGQLLERCPVLFSRPPEQRAAALFGELLGAGLTAAAAAACFSSYPVAAKLTTLAPGLSELAAILAHSRGRDSSLRGRVAQVPAAQRTVAALLNKIPSAVMLVCRSTGHLKQRAAELQQAGFTAAEVAALAWSLPDLLWTDSAARVASRAAVVQQELGLPAAEVVSLVAKRKPGWLGSSVDTLRERAAALAEGFGQAAAAAMLLKSHSALNCDPGLWRRNLCYMAACGVADPKAALRHAPLLLHVEHAAPDFLQRRLMLQQVAQLTAAQLYERHPGWLRHRKVPDLAQRLQFVEQRGRSMQQLVYTVLHRPLSDLLAAVGAGQAEWEAWAAANPPAACPLYRWAQQAAAKEAARLAEALPPELAQAERLVHSQYRRRSIGQ